MQIPELARNDAIWVPTTHTPDIVGFDAHIEPTAKQKNGNPRFDVGIEPYEPVHFVVQIPTLAGSLGMTLF